MLSESKIIKNLQFHSEGFIGDDAAVLPELEGNNYVITKDLLVQDIHFRIEYFSPEMLAHKALHVNLSDLAAMGAKPLYILCGIAIPENLQEYAKEFLNELILSCKNAAVILIGGDTTASKDSLSISITAIGVTAKDKIKYRSTAQTEDLICVAGNLGWASLGLEALEKGSNTDPRYINSFLYPEAKIAEGLWLAKQGSVTSMMDLSDGLYIDLKRLCESSNKGALIDLNLLELYCEPLVNIKNILEGGEDYALLFTVKKSGFQTLEENFLKVFKYKPKVIGNITSQLQIRFQKNSKDIELEIEHFTHFGENSKAL